MSDYFSGNGLSRSRFIGEEEVVQSAEIKEYLGNTDYAACR